MNKLNENIKSLEILTSNLEESIRELKKIYEKNEKDKEELKLEIQKTFTQLRNLLNEREDKLLSDVDKKFDELFFGEETIKEFEKLPDKVKKSLEIWKSINTNLNNNSLNSLINDCLYIENNIEEINKINLNMKKYNIAKIKIKFFKNDDNEGKLSEKIKNYGVISEYPFSNIIKREDYIKINEMIGGNNNFLLMDV